MINTNASSVYKSVFSVLLVVAVCLTLFHVWCLTAEAAEIFDENAVMPIAVDLVLFCGIAAGLLVRNFYKGKHFFDFTGFDEPKSCNIDSNLIMRLLKNIAQGIKWINRKSSAISRN